MNDSKEKLSRISRTAEIVAAFLANQEVDPDAVPGVIEAVHSALSELDLQGALTASTAVMASPAAVRRSIRPDALISFIDGKPYTLLKQHLMKHGLTPDAYRAKYGLPADYPMMAAAYAQFRSELAYRHNFGQVRRGRKAAGSRAKDASKTP